MRHYYGIEYHPLESHTKHIHRFDCKDCRDSWSMKSGSYRYAIKRKDLTRGQLAGYSNHYHDDPMSKMDWIPESLESKDY